MFMIAGSWLIFFKPVAFVLLMLGCILAITRVLGGVHFPKDVIAGALAALIWGHVCYIMLPIW
jgi:membrane-associated phospholipid phosphatase